MTAKEVTLVKSWKGPEESQSFSSGRFSELCLNQLHSLNMIKPTFESTNIPHTRLFITVCDQACCQCEAGQGTAGPVGMLGAWGHPPKL